MDHFRVFPVAAASSVVPGACSCRRGAECEQPGKHPLVKDWQRLATSDSRAVAVFAREFPGSNVGLATGEGSGVWVLDLDLKTPKDGGLTGIEAWERLCALHPDTPATLTARTGGGGLHLYWRWDGRKVRNRGGLKVDGQKSSIDVRGEGGYVLLPPSNHASGGHYAWIDAAVPIAKPPEWLLDLVAPVEAPRAPTPQPTTEASGREASYARKVLARACEAVAGAGVGGRHQAVLRHGVVVGGYAHLLPGGAGEAVEALVAAAVAAGKSEREARAAAAGAVAKGAERPFTVPDRQPRRTAAPSGPVELDDEDQSLPLEELEPPAEEEPPPPAWQDEDEGRDFLAESESVPPVEPVAEIRRRPCIIVNDRQISAVIADARNALAGLRGVHAVYQRDGRLVRLHRATSGRAVIEELSQASLRGQLHRAADWVMKRPAKAKEKHDGSGFVEVPAPALPGDVVPALHEAGGLGLPELQRVAVAPFFASGGRLVCAPGYDRETETFLVEARAVSPVDGPGGARWLLEEWLGDFPFERESDRAHALAFMLAPLVRNMIAGPVPMTVFEAPTPGTGKSMLMGLLATVGTGRPCSPAPLSSQEEERRKALVSVLAEGVPVALVDNVRGRLADPALEGILTAFPSYSDRLMGGQRRINVQALTVWGLSGNNLVMVQDLARRTVGVRLNANTPRPEDRSGFRIPNLEAYTIANLDMVRSCAIGMVRAWVDAGMPSGGRTLGSFAEWARVLGGILEVCEVPGFLADRAEHRAAADPEAEDWLAVLEWWANEKGIMRQKSAGDVAKWCGENGLCLGLVGDGSSLAQARRVAAKLDGSRGAVFEITGPNGAMRVRVVKASARASRSFYSLEDADRAKSEPLPFRETR